MVPVTFSLQLLLVVLILRQSAAASDQCSDVREDMYALERDIVRITEQKKNYEIQAGNCQEQLKKQIRTSQKTEALHNNLKKKQLEANEEVLKNITDKQTQMQIAIDGLTKAVESLNRKADLESVQWKAVQTAIDGLRKTVESINLRTQGPCRTEQEVCPVLLEAAESGDVNTAKALFKCSNDRCSGGGASNLTPLMYAGGEGHVEVVRVLLEEGANTEIVNNYGSTALHHAAYYGHLDVCRLLLNWGAKVNAQNKNGDTPLRDAALWGHLSIVKLLVERGADINLRNKNGQTATDVARSQGMSDVADWLDSVNRCKGR